MRDVIGRIADYPIKRIDELLPWNWINALPPVKRRIARRLGEE